MFPEGATDTRKSDATLDETLSGFPCFQVKDPDEKLGFLSYGGAMFGDGDKHMATYVFPCYISIPFQSVKL